MAQSQQMLEEPLKSPGLFGCFKIAESLPWIGLGFVSDVNARDENGGQVVSVMVILRIPWLNHLWLRLSSSGPIHI